MFEGGGAESASGNKVPQGNDAQNDVRIFSMPEALRNKAATLYEEPKKEAELQPLIIPFALPQEQVPVQDVPVKKRTSPVLIGLLLLVLFGAMGAGAWWYVAVYSAEEEKPVVPEPVVPVEPKPEPKPKDPFPGTDTDSDGLTNVEELLYGTDFRSPDTDKDTYLDGNEVFHRYDPNGLAPSTLLDTGSVRVLDKSDIPFTIFYPASWTVSPVSSEGKILFRSAESGQIEVVFSKKDPLTSLESWMSANDISVKNTEETMTKEGYPAITTRDGRVFYLDVGAWAVSATYNLGDNLSIDFLQTFKMMMNSVRMRVSEEASEKTEITP